MDWPDQIRARFPDWKTESARQRWPQLASKLSIGQKVFGTVIARAPFGVWLDLGFGFPGLLLVPEMQAAKISRITFDDYPPVGATVEGWICALSDAGEIALTQHHQDDDPWQVPAQFAVGKEFLTHVARVMDYGYLLDLVPGIQCLLRPEKTSKRLFAGDECRVHVESVDPVRRKIEVCEAGCKEFAFNRDWNRRNSLLRPFLRIDGVFANFDESSDLFYFQQLPLQVLKQLIDEKFIDPDERINDSPSTAEYFDLISRHPSLSAHGYATHSTREDYRVSIEGIWHAAPVSETLLLDAKKLCGFADQFRLDDEGLYVWFD